MIKNIILYSVFFILGIILLKLLISEDEVIEVKNIEEPSTIHFPTNNNIEQPLTLMVIPLDDRPVNTFYPESISKVSGTKVILPPNDLIGTFDKEGDRKKLKEWIILNGYKVDGFVISATMMNHGGLVHSRKEIKKEDNTLQWVKDIKMKYPNKKVYVYDVIQRLTITVENQNQQKLYSNIRDWTTLKHQVEVTQDNTDKEKLKLLEDNIPKETLNKYLLSREINHSYNMDLIDFVQEGYIDYLVFSQDDASKYGIHKQEQEKLKNKIKNLKLENKIDIIAGTDEIDLTLMTKFLNEHYNHKPNVYIHYSNQKAKEIIFPYEDRTLEETVRQHIKISNGKIVHNEQEADLHLYIYTTLENKEDVDKYLNKIKDSIHLGHKVSIVDLSMMKMSSPDLFTSQLNKHIDLASVVSYSSWNTVSNSVGIGLSHSFSRLHSLSLEDIDSERELSHYKYLYFRYTKDYLYKRLVSQQLSKELLNQNIDIYSIPIKHLYSVEDRITFELKKNEERWLKQYFNKNNNKLPVSFEVVRTDLPWYRLFEAKIDINTTIEH